MTDSTTRPDSIGDIPSDADSRLKEWETGWDEILVFDANQIPFSVCPSLSHLASAKSQEELEKASNQALSEIDKWRGAGVGSRSQVEDSTSKSTDRDPKDVVSSKKALQILGLEPSWNMRGLRRLVRLTPDVPDSERVEPTVVSNQKALKILGVDPDTGDTRDSVLLARLAPHVQKFVEEKIKEMQSLLAEPQSAALTPVSGEESFLWE